MIYGNAILENQFNALTDTLSTIQEFYENEISFLNTVLESNTIINEDNELTVTSSNTKDDSSSNSETENTKNNFIKRIIEKAKELVKKFIEWCKKIYNNIKNYVIKDSETMKKEIKAAIKDIEKATTIKDLQKYSGKLGLIITVDKQKGAMFFDVKKYIDELNIFFGRVDDKIKSVKEILDKDLNDLYNNKKISNTEKSTSSVQELKKEVLERDKAAKPSSIKYYYNAYKAINKELTVPVLKEILIQAGIDSINAIDYIDAQIKSVTDNIKKMENGANNILSELKRLKDEDYDSKSVQVCISTINTSLTMGKHSAQLRVKYLNRAKNVYRIGARNSAVISHVV